MAVFTAAPTGSLTPDVQFNLPGDLQAAQQIQQGQNALTTQAQQVADMQQEVALRPGIAAGDPNALNQLSAIDPQAAAAQRQAQIAQAQLPYTMAQNRIALLGQGARGVLASDDHPAAYAQWLSSLPAPIASTLPQSYPGDGATQQMAFAAMSPDDFIKYQQTHIVGTGTSAAPSTYSGAVAGAESGNDPNATSATSTASGPDQFINSTWLDEMKAHRPDLTNGKTDSQILAMRGNPQLSAQMTDAYASDNAPQLAQHSIPITPASLYAAHHFGPQGAIDLYAAENNNPSTPVTAIFPPDVIKANPGLAGQTAGSLLGGIRTRMANVTPGTFGSDLAATQPVAPPQAASGSYVPAVGPNAGSSQPLAASSPAPSGVTPLYHGDGTPALVDKSPGYQLARGPNGIVQIPVPGGPADPAVIGQQAQIKSAADAGYNIVNGQYVPIAGGPADPAVIARNRAATAQAGAAANGPIPGGVPVAPAQTATSGPFPLPPTDPYAGQNNNAALATRMNDDRTEANKTVAADAPIIQKDLANIQFDQQFHGINAANPTGPNAGSAGAGLLRSNVPFTPSQAPYQEMQKLSANLQTAALPTNLGRLDLPIIKSVAAQQPTVTNLRQANDNIENIQIAAAQRDIDYRTARQQYVQQFGHLDGFEQMWADYNNHVPTLSYGSSPGTVQLAQGQPGFQQWVGARAPGGRYNPALAAVPDNQLPGAQQPQQPQGQPQTQQASAQPTQRQAIPPAAVAYLHANPGTAAQFDQMFGAGSSRVVLGQ